MQLRLALGHEILGEVAAIGPDAKAISVGTRQIVYPWPGCDYSTQCAQDEESLCAAQGAIWIFQWPVQLAVLV